MDILQAIEKPVSDLKQWAQLEIQKAKLDAEIEALELIQAAIGEKIEGIKKQREQLG